MTTAAVVVLLGERPGERCDAPDVPIRRLSTASVAVYVAESRRPTSSAPSPGRRARSCRVGTHLGLGRAPR